jgi:hypothetical protein
MQSHKLGLEFSLSPHFFSYFVAAGCLFSAFHRDCVLRSAFGGCFWTPSSVSPWLSLPSACGSAAPIFNRAIASITDCVPPGLPFLSYRFFDRARRCLLQSPASGPHYQLNPVLHDCVESCVRPVRSGF